MIYRIAVYRDGKFDHYATPEELCLLRVNADGRVEALMVNGSLVTHPPRFHLLDVELDDDGDTPMGVYGKWYDVSDTHKVEWGVYDPLADPQKCRIYENDIVRDCGGVVKAQYDIKNIIYWMAEATIATEDVLGNIHENPELLGGEE